MHLLYLEIITYKGLFDVSMWQEFVYFVNRVRCNFLQNNFEPTIRFETIHFTGSKKAVKQRRFVWLLHVSRRKNYLFAGSHEAAHRAAMVYSLLATCNALSEKMTSGALAGFAESQGFEPWIPLLV